MSATVQTVRSSPAKALSIGKGSKAAVDGNDDFQAELTRAADRKPSRSEPAKEAKPAKAKKTDAAAAPVEEAAATVTSEPTAEKPKSTLADQAETPIVDDEVDAEAPVAVEEATPELTTELDPALLAVATVAPQDDAVVADESTPAEGAPLSIVKQPIAPAAVVATEAEQPSDALPETGDVAKRPTLDAPAKPPAADVAPQEVLEATDAETAAPLKAVSGEVDKSAMVQQLDQQLKPIASNSPADKPQALPTPQTPPETRFAETNHNDIVRSIRTELLPRGGSMQIRLDPPDLGQLQITVSLRDGVVTASFQAANDDAARLLSHSLSQLKAALESTGVTVDKLQVQQAPRDQAGRNAGDDSQQRQQPGQDDMSRQQERQRKEMLQRMWRRLSMGSDPLDMVA